MLRLLLRIYELACWALWLMIAYCYTTGRALPSWTLMALIASLPADLLGLIWASGATSIGGVRKPNLTPSLGWVAWQAVMMCITVYWIFSLAGGAR